MSNDERTAVAWDWVRSFVWVVEAGGMSRAAEQFGVSQPTLSRHVRALEEALGLDLFDRSGRGLQLSPRGTALYERATGVQTAMDAFSRQAFGFGEEIAGSVRLTATHSMALFVLPEWLAGFRERYPHVAVEMVLDDSELNLLTREAEVAVRMFRPRQLDLLTRPCGRTTMGFYASEAYLARRGMPVVPGDLLGHDLVGFDRQTDDLDAAARLGLSVTRASFAVRTDSVHAQVFAVRAGCGIAALSTLAGSTAGLIRILPTLSFPGQELWLTAHPEIHRNPRVRTLFRDLGDFLVRRLEAD